MTGEHARMSASARMVGLARQIERDGQERISSGAVVDALGDTGLGLTLMLLMLPVFISIPGLPVGIVFGFLVAVLGVQIIGGAHSLHLPAVIRLRDLPTAQVCRVLLAAAPWLARIERWLSPGRLPGLATAPVQRVLGGVLVLLGLALAVPIPLGNYPPALAVVALAIGLMERDGLAIAVGLALTVLAVAWNLALILASAEIIAWLATHLGF